MINLTVIILNLFDFFHKFKIVKFLKKIMNNDFNLVFDIGAHKGESINLFLSNFKVNKIISFEASPINFEILKKKENKLKKKFPKSNIIIENKALGSLTEKKNFKQFQESSSSTLSQINQNSRYFKKKFSFINFFKKKDNFYDDIELNISTLDDYINYRNIGIIDLVKIDTEGSEFDIIKGAKENIKNFKLILFEHHYDDMIVKNYTFSDINDLLNQNNFFKIFKAKMPFRKTFEYIYINKIFGDNFKF
tara:strand:- start:1274 stop:2020 length:747 start_codon:yes stop_codon:yes gene_type:complete